MSAPTDTTRAAPPRTGSALLIALVMLLVLGVCAIALWETERGVARTVRLQRAALRVDADADALLARAVASTTAGGWRGLEPARTETTHHMRSARSEHLATLTRLGWTALLLRGAVRTPSGVTGTAAHSDHRLLVPLRPPFATPVAAITGGQPWSVGPSVVLDTAPAGPVELVCRAGIRPVLAAVDSRPAALDPTLTVPLDADTVSGPVRGVFRLMSDRITRPVVVEGIVESVTGLLLGADLQLAGVLVVQGSVQSAGGRLAVTGAVITRDSGGGRSVLGTGDRVRYDACAIRRAMERATRPALAGAWTIVGWF